jgi:4-carboxymuconolactone decarboxylase
MKATFVAAPIIAAAALFCAPVAVRAAQADLALPKDISPESRSRLPLVNRSELNEEGKKAYDAAASQAPSGRPEGAAAIRQHRSGADVRGESPVGRALTELAILAIAREHDQPYEWSLHEMERTRSSGDRDRPAAQAGERPWRQGSRDHPGCP